MENTDNNCINAASGEEWRENIFSSAENIFKEKMFIA